MTFNTKNEVALTRCEYCNKDTYSVRISKISRRCQVCSRQKSI